MNRTTFLTKLIKSNKSYFSKSLINQNEFKDPYSIGLKTKEIQDTYNLTLPNGTHKTYETRTNELKNKKNKKFNKERKD